MGIKKIARGQTLLKWFSICELTGEVLDQEKSSRTEVSGTVTGGGTNSVYGTTAPVRGKVESTTTTFQTLYLKDDENIEHVVQLVDLEAPCRAGHTVTVWRLGRNRWIRAYNHNTQESYYYDDMLKLMYPKIFYFLFGIIFASWAMGDARTSGFEFGIFWLFYWLLGLAIGVLPSYAIAFWRDLSINRVIKKKSTAIT